MKCLLIGTAFCSIPQADSFSFSNFYSDATCVNKVVQGRSWLKAVATMPENKFADLTPAVDKFVSLPQTDMLQSYSLTAKGPVPPGPEPFKLVADDIQPLSDYVKELVESENPVLTMAATHFFSSRQGKRFRPTIVALISYAMAPANAPEAVKISPVQLQLGQITEMIHVASLIHDDVLDEADTRRGGQAVHKLYSNKVAVLAGDYLLARASVLLARLENTAVVQIMATALESLVAGEIMQLKSPPKSLLEMESYLRKSYYKTASLICYACRSTALLGGHAYGSTVATACEEFGFHLGLAYQIQDDILDFTAAASVLGKPALADMDLGLSTAPILYAAQEDRKLRPLIMRRFKEKGDKQQ